MADVHRYDVIVIGLGAMGSAALDHLARRGADVLGLERYGVPHEHGSSGGDTRLIRKAYFEHPDYVPLLQRAYSNWDDLEARSGERVLFRTGAVYIGRSASDLISGSRESARLYDLVCDELSSDAVARRWDPLRVPEGYDALHEPEGGFVLAGKSIRLHCESALRHGARVQAGEAVQEWTETPDGVEVVTSTGTYRAARLIITVGSWASTLLPRVKTPLDVTRQALFWVWPNNVDAFSLDTFACWAAQIDGYDGTFYGFPVLPASMGGQLGLKIAHHVKGLPTQPDQRCPDRGCGVRTDTHCVAVGVRVRPWSGRGDQSVHVHVYGRPQLHRRPIPAERACGDCVWIQRPRFQVRVCDRRSAGRSRAGRAHGVADRFPRSRTVQ